MVFNSYNFIFFFFPIFLLVWVMLLRTQTMRWSFLLVSSCFFYASWDYRFIALLAYITLVNYFSGAFINKTDHKIKRKRILVISIVLNLLPLFFFKYLPWLGSYFTIILNHESQSSYNSFLSSILLPVGISFFTFQALTYTIGLYNRQCNYCPNILKFATYICMFPQLLSGPIVRYQDLDDQLENIGKVDKTIDILGGLELFCIGLVKKVVFADRIGSYINPVFQQGADLSPIVAWAAILGYSLQIYFDFSGYSDMAIGIGKCLGLKLPVNFLAPYTASNPSDFWRRWHISLSTWLRDYLFIPLGGSRQGSLMTLRNLMLTMFLAGIWHGANWTFVVWGIWHGVMLCTHRITPRHIREHLPGWFSIILLNIAVLIGWIFFRSSSIEQAFTFMQAMTGLKQSINATIAWPIFVIIPVGYCINFIERRMTDNPAPRRNFYTLSLALASAWAILELGNDAPFIYFQF